MADDIKPGCLAIYQRYFPRGLSEDLRVRVIEPAPKSPNGSTKWLVELLDVPDYAPTNTRYIRVSAWKLAPVKEEVR